MFPVTRSSDIYGLIATHSKEQTVAKGVLLFMRRLCASPPLADFAKKSAKRALSGE
jgi:hypothetical protein